jgi:hypothetical protein
MEEGTRTLPLDDRAAIDLWWNINLLVWDTIIIII